MKIKRRYAFGIILASALLAAQGYATLQNISMAAYAGKVPSVPASTKDAFNKCEVVEGSVKAGPLLQKLGEELEGLVAKTAELYGMDDMKGVQDQYGSEEMQAQIEGMTMEQKIAMGMNIQKQLGLGTQQGGTQQNLLMVEALKLNKELTDFDGKLQINERWGALQAKINKQHDDVENETRAAVKACPTGNMGEPDPACVKAKERAGMEKHVAAAEKGLKDSGAVIADYTAKVKQLLAKVDAFLAKIQYGAKIVGNNDKNTMNNLQVNSLGRIILMRSMTETAQVEAAEWFFRKKQMLEKN